MAIGTQTQCEIKHLGRPDEVRTFDKGRLEIFNLAGKTIGRATFEPGWKWSECVKPITKTEWCESEHLGFLLSGTMHIKTRDGQDYELREGDAFCLPSGHDAWVVGDKEVDTVDFQGYAEYAKPAAARPKREGRKH